MSALTDVEPKDQMVMINTRMQYKKCSWLMRGKATTCQIGAVGRYCAQHNYQIKHGAQPFHPCRVCNAGCRVEHRLCKACCEDDLEWLFGLRLLR